MLSLLLFLYLANSGESKPYNEAYKDINSASFCVQFMNATHKFGCTSKTSGNVGRLYFVENRQNLNDILNGKVTNVIALLGPIYSDGNSLKKLKNSGNCVGAVILMDSNISQLTPSKAPSAFSPDSACPNSRHDFYGGTCHSWNSDFSSSQYYQDFSDFPIAAVHSSDDISSLVDCISQHGKFCSARMESFMMSAGNSLRCLWRTNTLRYLEGDIYCIPLGGYNFHLPLFLPSTPQKISNVIWVVAKLDGMSEFPGLSPVADSVLSGLIATIAVIEKMNQLGSSFSDKTLFFSFFAGEPFDYIGSSSTVLDIAEGNWNDTVLNKYNLSVDSIAEMYEISQIISSNGELYVHQNDMSSSAINKEIFDDINTTATELNITVKLSNGDLPPTPIQSFMKKNSVLPATVLTGYDKHFKSNLYNSIFDQLVTLECAKSDCITQIVNAANLALKFLYKRLTKKTAPLSVSVNTDTVLQLFDCFLKNVNCSLIRAIMPNSNDILDKFIKSQNGNGLLPFVVGPYDGTLNLYSLVAQQLIIYYGGNVYNTSKDDCKRNETDPRDFYTYSWMVGNDSNPNGVCFKSPLFYSTALSPAFKDQDAAEFSDSLIANYSSWTISNYEYLKLSIFASSTSLYQGLFVFLGIVICSLALLLCVLYQYNLLLRCYIDNIFS